MHKRQFALFAGSILALQLLTPGFAVAQVGRVGDTQIAMTYPLGRWPDVEYDSNNQVYLATRGYNGSVLGAFLRPDGTPFTAAFDITRATNVTTSRVCFAQEANVFLVTWQQEPSFIKGRLLRFAAGFPQFLSDIFEINTVGPKFTEAAPSCAYSSDADRFLVTWAMFGASQDVRGQFVSLDGTLIGSEIPIAVSPAWESLPSVAYNPRQQEFFVVYTSETSGQFATGARVQANTGNVLATTPLYGNGLSLNNYPEVAYNSVNDEYFVVTWHITATGGGDVWGHRVSTHGVPIGDKIPVEANPFFEGGDGIGLAYNSSTNSYFVASQGPSGEVIGAEVSAAGQAGQVFRVTVLNDGHREIYQPQIAASPHGSQFLVVANVDFSRMAAQVIGTGSGPGPGPPPPPPPPPPPSCPYSLNDNGRHMLPSGGAGTVTLTTNAGCAWTASSNAAWLLITWGTSGTGTSTISWYAYRNPSSAPRAASLTIGGQSFVVSQNGASLQVVDFNSDGASDILWQNESTGQLSAWRMSGVNLLEGVWLSPHQVSDPRWRIVGTADFNADRRTDLLWQHDLGYVAIWFMDGERMIAGDLLTLSPIDDRGWRIVATGDVDGDNMPDILWQHTDGRVAVWYMDGWHYRFGEVFVSLSDPSWRVVGATDVNGDRRLDLVWHHATRGDVAVWFMAGRVLLDGVQVNESLPDTNWHIVAVNDLDRDGAPDLIWQNMSTGRLAAWMLDGALVRYGVTLNPAWVGDTNWKIVGPR
jgi:hypothetical protein